MKIVDTQSEAYRKVHFAVMAIEGSAQKEQISRETATNEWILYCGKYIGRIAVIDGVNIRLPKGI